MCDDLLQEYVREVIINTISENNMPTNKDGIYWKLLAFLLASEKNCHQHRSFVKNVFVLSPTSLIQLKIDK